MIEHALNECVGCSHTWYVRGGAPSLQCPRCRGRSVTVVPAAIILAPEAGQATQPAADRTRFWIMLGTAATVLGIAMCGAVTLIVLVARDRNRPVDVARNVAPTDPSSETERSAPPTKPAVRPDPPSQTEPLGKPPVPTPEVAGKPLPGPTPEVPAEIIPPPRLVPGVPAAPVLQAPPVAKIAIAPPPRRVLPIPLPAGGWSSGWDRGGDIRVRVRAVAVTRARLVDVTGRLSDSPSPQLVIWLEIENVSATKPHEYRRWQPLTSGECVLAYPTRNTVGVPVFPEGKRLVWPGEYKQTLKPGGPAIPEILVFNVPIDEAKQVTLILRGERVSEAGDYRFDIPASAWKK